MSKDIGPHEHPREIPLVSAILDSVADAVVEYRFVHDTPIVRRANPAFVEAFVDAERSPRERPLEMYVESPRDVRPAELQIRDELTEAEVTRRTVDGWQPFSVRVLPVPDTDADRPRQVAVYSDLPLRSQYDDKLEALHEATRELIQQNTRESVAQSSVDAAMEVLDLSATSVHLYDDEHDVLTPAATTGHLEEIIGDPPDLPLDASLAGSVYTSGDPIVYDHPDDHPGVFNPDTALESEVVLPLGDYGVMMSGSTMPSAFSDRRVWLATILASNTEAALDRIEREETLAARERELTRKNERLESFAKVVSHDLRSPLNVAAGRVQLAAEEHPSEHLDVADNALERMETLIHDLLELARHGGELTSREEISVDTVTTDAWTQVQTGKAALEQVGEIGTVLASPSQLTGLFENLFRNAVEHAGPDVTVTVGPTPTGFYVADDGPGIPEEQRETVFDVGETSQTDGTGMGLAIVEQITQAHGWEVTLTESADGGARFEFDVTDA